MKITIIDINNEYGGGQVFLKHVLSNIDGEKTFLIKSKRLFQELTDSILLKGESFFEIAKEINEKLTIIKPDLVLLNGGFALFLPLVCKKKWKYIFYKHATYKGVSLKKRFIYFLLINFSYFYAKRIICVSKYCVKEELFFKKKMVVIYHGVNVDNACFKHKKNNQLRFIYVGRIVKEKGCDVILQYFKTTKLPNRELLVVGDDTKANFSIEQYKDSENIKFCGLQNNVKEFLQESDFLITLPTNEAFGLTIIEAMVNGVIVITTNVGGIPEIISNGETGFIIKPEELTILLDSICDVNNYTQIKVNAFEKVKSCFNINNEIKSINRIIKETL